MIQGRKVSSEGAEEWKLILVVIADSKDVIGSGAQPSIHFTVIVFVASALIGVVRIRVGAAHIGIQPIGFMWNSFIVRVT